MEINDIEPQLISRLELAYRMVLGPNCAIMSSKGPCCLRIERTKYGYYMTALDNTSLRKTMNIRALISAISDKIMEYDSISASVFITEADVEKNRPIAEFIISTGLSKKLKVGRVATVTNGSLMVRDDDEE